MQIKNTYLIVVRIALLALEVNCYEFTEFVNSKYYKCQHDKKRSFNASLIDVHVHDFGFRISSKHYPMTTAARHIMKPKLEHLLNVQFVVFVPDHANHNMKSTSTKFIKPEDLMIQTFRNVRNVCLLLIDHSEYTTGNGNKVQNYEKAVSYTYYIGNAIGRFLGELSSRGVLSKNINVIGHGLGAQMLAHAGPTYYGAVGEKFGRITGVDPEGPCFSNAHVDNQLRKGFADFVDIYHCNAGVYGTSSNLGDADFYFNYRGMFQPGCSHNSKAYRDKCSHIICLELWARSVTKNYLYIAWKCDSYDAFANGECKSNEATIAGYGNTGNVAGTFYTKSAEDSGIAEDRLRHQF